MNWLWLVYRFAPLRIAYSSAARGALLRPERPETIGPISYTEIRTWVGSGLLSHGRALGRSRPGLRTTIMALVSAAVVCGVPAVGSSTRGSLLHAR